MGFLSDDEYIILMDVPLVDGRMLSVDELKKLRDCGIQTALWFGPMWDEYTTQGNRYIYKYIQRVQEAGLKCLIILWVQQITTLPLRYYVKSKGNPRIGTLSPWNPEAQELSNELLASLRDRFTSDKVQFISGQNQGGERILFNKPAYYDSYAIADWQKHHKDMPDHTTPEGEEWLKQSYIKLLLDQQRILVNTQHREIWYSLSRYKAIAGSISCHGCEWIDDYLASWQTLEPSSINHISYNYFPYGDRIYPLIAKEQATWGVNEFVGAEYCEGLRAGNGRLAVEHGLRGMIVGPTHPLTKHSRIEKWMLDEISKTQRLFEARQYVGR